MRRDPATGDPDFFSFARDYLHVYMPRIRALSPRTIEAYRISLECFLGYLAETGHTGREHVSFDHFDRQHLKAWLAWMTDHQGYAPKTVTLRLSAVKAFLAYASQEDITLIALSQAARCSRPFTVSMKVTFMMAMCRHGEPRRAGCRAGFRWPGCRGGGQSVAVSSAMAVRAADSSAMVLPAV